MAEYKSVAPSLILLVKFHCIIQALTCHIFFCSSTFCALSGFPDVLNLEDYETACERTEDLQPDPTTRMSALLADEEQVS